MKILMEKSGNSLVPVYRSDYEEISKINDRIWVNIEKARNYEFHKKFFALIKIGWNNSKKLELPFDAYRAYVTMKAGFFNTFKTPKGIMILPKSIKFDKMTEEEFKELYNRAIDIIIEDIGGDKEAIELILGLFL